MRATSASIARPDGEGLGGASALHLLGIVNTARYPRPISASHPRPCSQGSPTATAPSRQAKRPASPMAVTPAVTTPKRAPPPPVFIHEKDKWTSVSAALNERKIAFTNARSTQHGIKVTVPSPNDYRELSKFLKSRNIAFHSYSLPEGTPERVIIKGIPHQIKTEEVLEDLKSQGEGRLGI
ncbi:hypothetical protein PYW07_013243 [Mythimna separata]|uniref:Uncharacterized protein n=1 Tax=Mythimna separata TaxID=271217 RepID=A0AAD7Y671_MYTSE|nr:hypothetical protein PYW07_013243 [Mythimna separata]